MKSIVNATLSYGLINVPVGVATAAKRQETSFRTLHKLCGTPVNQGYRCSTCEINLETHDTVKGFEFVKGQFVQIEESDLDKVKGSRSRVIGLRKFIDMKEIKELQIEKNYYLVPNATPALATPYALLADTLSMMKVLGIGNAHLWGKEYPCLIRPLGKKVLTLSMMFCSDEVVPSSEIESSLPNGLLGNQEKMYARELVSMLTRPLAEDDLVSEERGRVNELVGAKIAGAEIAALPEVAEQPPTVDVLAALRASIAFAKEEVSA